ncbi:hypothetical protein N7509_004778 [Penicillium cosmopolitanum]|uniref:Uncharacterized protein n=1 Tax=Penicillium cosmopolitanum TaxID=1131564 RepID=A0A9W9W0Z3_9EURO|nr:uncharacterized protein N7509_004778 [Penicillium cosmopolitanum]KAJ5396665.1 hypothetical protein N7509_004778 [Penicillium cosmopolitanum]
MKYFIFWTILLLAPFAAADDWEDFTNNLATDLAPLITLFGERLTKQFLSESISLLDNIIFALSPLGVLTAVVSVIRVCGSSSLKAFVGRAQEGPAEAESELLPCVSQSTAELFNDGGISRVFGRPRIVEIVSWDGENKDPKTGKGSVEFGTLRDAIRKGAWSAKGSGLASEDLDDLTRLPELDIPNLSLNKGIKRRHPRWFKCAAILGAIMQIGVIIYAAITVFLFPGDFEKDDKPVASYAFPFYVVGTTLLFAGMLFCAIIIERSSKQYYIKPNKPNNKIYWLQPGNQHVGDQVFGAFMAVRQGPESSMSEGLEYIKSTRFPKYDGRYVELYTVLGSTMLGFIIQFVGLRGLHASVILAQLGSTFIMSILRTCLRTQRMAPEENLLKDERDLATQRKQELDAFAFYLRGVASFEPASSTSTTPRSNSSDSYVAHPEKPLVKEIIETRALLADITSKQESKHGLNVPWDDIPTRKVAKSLADTIGMTMDLLSSWGVEYEKEFRFDLSFECKLEGPERTSYSHGQHPIRVQRSGDALKWKVDQSELEAIIGLSTWSLYKFDEGWKNPLVRMVGLNESEAGTLEMYLDFHKWIFQQTEAKIVSAETIDSSKRLFGFESDRYVYDNDILVVRTENSVETMVAQDIYIQFLHNALKPNNAFKGDTLLNDSIHSSTFRQSFSAKNSQIEELIHCFESCMLGSREDALLCAIPTLRSLNLLPELAGDSAQVRKQIEDLISQNNWEKAFRLLEWICERSQGDELRNSAYELGYLCRRALMVHDASIRGAGLKYMCKILKKNIRGDFLNSQHVRSPMHWSESSQLEHWLGQFSRELGWIAWHISSNIPSAECIQPTLKSHGVLESLGTSAESGEDAKLSIATVKATQEFLTLSAWDIHHRDLEGNDDELGYIWALKEDLGAIAYLLCIAARHPAGQGVNVLLRHGADIGASDERTISALLQAIDENDLIAAETLLENGANPNGNEKGPDANPLGLCAQRDLTDMAQLLLGHGASVYTTDASGMSALHWASNENKLGIASLLLSHGANVGKFGADGVIPLHCAVRNNYLDMTELLLKAGSETDAPGGNREKTSLMFAADSGFVDIVYMLLANGANVHARDAKGLTALDWAKISNRSDIVKILEEAT